ncbi:UNVERIFIED_CONTAM: hypothetical protein FKN15_002243 [Acipenser sinensis]
MVEVDLQVQCKRVGLEEPVRCEARPGLCSNALLYPQVAGIPVEAIRATVFYKQRWMLLLVDTSAACAKNPSVFDGTYLSWVTPRLLSPLVLHPTKFVDKQIKMGVEGRPLDEITATSRGYQLQVNSTVVKISIPFGAVGGYRKKGFTVTLGNFKPDVELKNLTINGVPLTLPEAENRGVKIIEVKHPNGTKDFVLKVLFAHPLIPEQYIGDNYRRYLLNINYTLNIIPVNEPYFHPATISTLVIIRRYLLNINYTLNIIPVNEPYFHPATIVCDFQDVGK